VIGGEPHQNSVFLRRPSKTIEFKKAWRCAISDPSRCCVGYGREGKQALARIWIYIWRRCCVHARFRVPITHSTSCVWCAVKYSLDTDESGGASSGGDSHGALSSTAGRKRTGASAEDKGAKMGTLDTPKSVCQAIDKECGP
jgi:hypothetical protein